VIAAIREGQPVLLPTDTVYGLVARAYPEEPTTRLYRLKGREERQPSALLASSVEMLFDCVPELQARCGPIVRELLPGPYTLVLSNPAGRYPWLTGTRRDAIGVRVPVLPDEARRALDAAGCVGSTSANDPGGPDPAVLDDVPARIRAACAEVDAGRLPGTASTVLDLTGDEPRVLREGAVSVPDALARVRDALS